jgi:small subunit ribosomal protein S20
LPNIKSAIKRVRVNKKKNLRNRMIKTAMRTSIKKLDAAVVTGTADQQIFSATVASIDKAASKGAIHKNAANRKKSRLAKRMNKAAAQ